MSDFYIGIEGSYQNFEIALFQGGRIIQTSKQVGRHASSSLLLVFQNLLDRNEKMFSDLDFIALNQGPGAFTSLRVLIATVNGLAFRQKKMLIGIDGLDALAAETNSKFSCPVGSKILCLLNAYNNDVYHGIYEVGVDGRLELCSTKGYKKIDVLLSEIASAGEKNDLILAGNGVGLHLDLIEEKLGSSILKTDFCLPTCSAEQIGKIGYEMVGSGAELSNKVAPLYLKTQMFAVTK